MSFERLCAEILFVIAFGPWAWSVIVEIVEAIVAAVRGEPKP